MTRKLHGLPVTGLVLHFRTPERTLSCIQSLADNGIDRVVVVDNSEDRGRSLGLMAFGLTEIRAEGVRVDVVTPARNLGFAGGVYQGIAAIGAPPSGHVLLINSDAVLEQGALEHMMTALSNARLVVPLVRERERGAATSLIAYYQRAFALILRSRWFGTVRHPSGCCLLIRKDLIEPRLFDQDFFFYGEDAMLGFELLRRGIAVAECVDAHVLHSGSASARNGSMFYEYHMNRAHWLLARKLSRNGFERLLFIGARCVTLPMRATVRSIRFRSLVPWRGLCCCTVDLLRGRCRSLTPPPAVVD